MKDLAVGQHVKLLFPSFVGYNGTFFPEERGEGKVIGVDVPCRVALGLIGVEVEQADGSVIHCDRANVVEIIG